MRGGRLRYHYHRHHHHHRLHHRHYNGTHYKPFCREKHQNFEQIKCQKSFAFESLLLGKLTLFQFIPVHSIAFIRHSRESERRMTTKNSNNVIVNFIVMTHRILISMANVEIDKTERFVGGLRHRRRTETVRLD